MPIIRSALMTTVLFVTFLFPRSGGLDSTIISDISDQLIKKEKIIGFKFPEYTENGSWKFRKSANWFSGFLSGEMWQMYSITKNDVFKKMALGQADNLLQFAGIDNTHDMGFIFLPSCYKAYLETGERKYLDAVLKAAEMLAKRFNKNGNFIRAWGSLGDPDRAGWMIIDTMMNLELLFIAAQISGNLEFYDIAYKHALTCLKENIRNDFSSFHIIEFDTLSGEVLARRTHQGYSDESTWARGQAWGIYGFANAYKYTGDERFLNASSRMADYFLSRLPLDLVPVWDLNLQHNELRDASAGAIAASGLFLLSELSKVKEVCETYENRAINITRNLLKNYLFTQSKREKEEGILLHAIYHYHNKWGVDESYPAGDYYFMEVLSKLNLYTEEKNFIRDEPFRREYNLNNNWFYIEENTDDPSLLNKSFSSWQKINLPHTWNKLDATDNQPGYRRDAGWYKKNIFIPDINNNLNFILKFEGINITSDVYVNGIRAGRHTGGYIGFEIDITPFLIKEEMNEILIRADNSVNRDIVPSQKSDFFIYGGINRDVWLKVVPSVYIVNSRISTPVVNLKKASTKIDLSINADIPGNYIIKVSIKDPSEKEVSSITKNYKMKKGKNLFNAELPEITDPLLWSPGNPNLYDITTEVMKGSKLIDMVTDPVGYRWFEFKPHGAFYLNGERLLVKGTHWHEDYAGLGNALSDSLRIKDFKMIKSLGANFVRLAHYPQDPVVYKMCDELGLLVWDELPWCRGGIGEDVWKENTSRMLSEIIDQNYNHPSIILWSLGNEIDWLPDFQGGDNNDSIRSFLKELNELAHSKDPYRLTSIRKYAGGADIVDVFSPSIWAGWYSGVYKNYQSAIEDAQKKYPRFLHMEFGGDSHVGRHTENTVDGEGILKGNEWEESIVQVKLKNIASMGDWSESYIVDLFDWHLRYFELSNSFTGGAQWAFKDFGTPLRPENPIPYINQKGLVDREGNPKDAFFVFKSYWNTEDKFCYIESSTWTERSGPENVKRELNVYSNCESVELFINGESQGKKIKDIKIFPASGLSWNVNFKEGKNKIKAVGYINNTEISIDTLTINYTFNKAGTPERIKLSAERLKNGNYLIRAIVVDKEGLRCSDYNKRIYFSVSGHGSLIENFGTPTGSSILEAANGGANIEFKPSGYERSVIEARNQDFKGDYIFWGN